MKPYFFSICLIMTCCTMLTAQEKPNQILKGIIQYDRTEEVVKDVKITPTIGGGNAAFSNSNGLFTLQIASGRPGLPLTLIVQKEGYRIIGHDPILYTCAIRETPADLVKIIVIKQTEYEKRTTVYVNAIEKQLTEKKEEISFLREQLSTEQLSDEERSALTRQITELTQKISQQEQSKEELAKRLAEIDLSQAADFVREAIEMVEQGGSIGKALELLEEDRLDRLYQQGVAQEEAAAKAKQQAIEGYMTRARLLITQLRYQEATQTYKKAIEKAPKNIKNLSEAAYFLAEQNELQLAIQYYEQALQLATITAQKTAFLNNLGVLYYTRQSLSQAQAAYEEALMINRALAEKNPDAFLPDVASTLNNLGNLYSAQQSLSQAQTVYKEALMIQRAIAEKNPDAFLPDVAMTLNNLGNLYSDKQSLSKAQTAYQEALMIYRALVEKNPDAFLPDVAGTLNNLGALHYTRQSLSKAQIAYEEALNIYRALVEKNPDAYNLGVCMTALNICLLYKKRLKASRDLGYKTKALKLLDEAAQCLSSYPESHPTAQRYWETYKSLKSYFESYR